MKIRIGDIYRIHLTKCEWAKQFVVGKVLDMSCGKLLSYATSKLLLENNANEVWNLDLLDLQQQIALRKLHNNKITYQLKNKNELNFSKFDTILALNNLSITDDINGTLKFIFDHLNPDGIAIISIINDDESLNSNHDLITKDLNIFSKRELEQNLKSYFNNITFFSQGIIRQEHNKERKFRNKLRTKIKKKLLKSRNRYNFYLKNLQFLHKVLAKTSQNRENKKTQKYKITKFHAENKPMFTIALCKK
jgi:2-polyprenyl-3-methyl-5-hydroxy-6-metoxy-1,4-benzoquinol methylase